MRQNCGPRQMGSKDKEQDSLQAWGFGVQSMQALVWHSLQ